MFSKIVLLLLKMKLAALLEPTPLHMPNLFFQTDGEGSNRYGRANTNYPVLETYSEGSILEVKIVVSTTHMVS